MINTADVPDSVMAFLVNESLNETKKELSKIKIPKTLGLPIADYLREQHALLTQYGTKELTERQKRLYIFLVRSYVKSLEDIISHSVKIDMSEL